MVSVAFTRQDTIRREKVAENKCYALPPGVRVRREGFGLLFYNSRNAKLTFVRSGALLEVSRDSQKCWKLTASGEQEGTNGEKVDHLVETLRKKGLIDET